MVTPFFLPKDVILLYLTCIYSIFFRIFVSRSFCLVQGAVISKKIELRIHIEKS